MHVRVTGAAVDRVAVLVKRGLDVDVHVVTMEVVQVLCDHDTLRTRGLRIQCLGDEGATTTIDERNLASRGLLVRHLVLPNKLAGTEAILNFLAREISTNTYLNLMDQYRPAYKAHQYAKLNRRITSQEYQQVVDMAVQAGLKRLDRRKPHFWIEF